jgi:hypothetical protein
MIAAAINADPQWFWQARIGDFGVAATNWSPIPPKWLLRRRNAPSSIGASISSVRAMAAWQPAGRYGGGQGQVARVKCARSRLLPPSIMSPQTVHCSSLVVAPTEGGT